MTQEKVDELKTHLSIVKKSTPETADQDYYNFMIKAKDALGESNYQMAQFYYEYADYILKKIESNMDIFNQQAMPNNAGSDKQEIMQNVGDEYESQSEVQQNPEKIAEDLNNYQAEVNQNLNQPQIVQGQEGQQPGSENVKQQNNQDDDDRSICLCNFNMAKNLYEDELQKIKKGQSQIDINEPLDGLKKALSKIGDIFMMDEDYTGAVELYQKVINQESERQGFHCSRFISHLYLLIGNSYLYQDCPDCQIKSIREFIKSVNILLSFLTFTLKYDTSGFQIPTEENPKVDRFHYMSMIGDTDEIKEVKDIIGLILDKIEDTYGQLMSKETYLAEKKKMTEESSHKNQFKPVSDSSKVVHIGTFGNRKRKPDENQVTPIPPDGYTPQRKSKQLQKTGKTESKPEQSSNPKTQPKS